MWKNLIQDFIGDLRTQKTRAFLTIFAVGWERCRSCCFWRSARG